MLDCVASQPAPAFDRGSAFGRLHCCFVFGPQLTDELAESQFPGCGGAEGLRRELLKVEAADRAGRQSKRVQVP